MKKQKHNLVISMILICPHTHLSHIHTHSFYFVIKVVEHFNMRWPRVSVCVCVYMQARVCVSLASDCLETIEVIIIKLGTVTASESDIRMHHVLMILTLTFIQGQRGLNRENNKMFDYFRNLSSNTHQVCPEDSLTKCLLYILIYELKSLLSLMTLLFTQSHNCISNETNF